MLSWIAPIRHILNASPSAGPPASEGNAVADQEQDGASGLYEALAHPIRVGALELFSDGPASPKQIAKMLRKPLGNVAYHVRVLAAFGLIELVEIKPRRGAREHVYAAIARARNLTLRLDERGYRELMAAVDELWATARKLEAQAARRLAKDDTAEAISVAMAGVVYPDRDRNGQQQDDGGPARPSERTR